MMLNQGLQKYVSKHFYKFLIPAHFLSKKFSFTYPCPRKLREIVKLSLFEKEIPTRIASIWNEYHSNRPNAISHTITATNYTILTKNARGCPMFIFPLKKPGGHIIMLMQNQGSSFIFTFLEDFKKNAQGAQPYLVLTCFNELMISKGLILIRGDILQGIHKNESEILYKLLMDYYLTESKYEIVKNFNRQSVNFDFNQYIDNTLDIQSSI